MSTTITNRQACPKGSPHGAVAGRKAVSAPLRQNPHAIRSPELELQTAIGREVRACRRRRGITASEVAETAKISVAMMSKIENGALSPSLATLRVVSRALGVPVSALLKNCDVERSAVFVKGGRGVGVPSRCAPPGQQQKPLGNSVSGSGPILVQPFLVTLTKDTDTFPLFRHEGLEFIYLLEGEMTYRHGTNLYHMSAGDSLYFEADSSHGPEHLASFPIRFLSLRCHLQCEQRPQSPVLLRWPIENAGRVRLETA